MDFAVSATGMTGIGDEQAIDVEQPYFEQLDPALLAEPFEPPVADGLAASVEEHALAEGPADDNVAPAITSEPSARPRPAVGTEPRTQNRSAHAPRSADSRGSQSGQNAQNPQTAGPRPQNGGPDRPPGAQACTAPQLRRFIKSRAYVPMHELRRRFAILGGDDDVSGIQLETGRIFVGLPPHEGQMLGELLRGGEVGFELSMDPETPIVVGVYAMRPVPRG
jgi:hypothetical protein